MRGAGKAGPRRLAGSREGSHYFGMKRILLATLLAMAILPAYAEQGPTETQQRLACMGDAFRLCPRSIPNRERIISCLASQRSALSASCGPVFDASLKAMNALRHH